MKRTTKNELGNLLEAISAAGIEDEGTIQKMLNIHGHEFQKTSKLAGAIELLGEKYLEGFRMDNFAKAGDENVKQASIPRKRVMSFINKRTHKARQLRNKRRVQHVRDNLEGQIVAYEDVLRYIKKIKSS